MSILIRYDKHQIVNGQSGAWFRGHEYGAAKDRRYFISYSVMENLLKQSPMTAADPLGKWTIPKIQKDGSNIIQFHFFTKEMTKALHHGSEAILNRLHRDAQRGASQAYVFQDIKSVDETGNMYALFNHNATGMALTSEQIKGMVGEDPRNLTNPSKIDYYFAYAAEGSIFSGREIIKAAEAFERMESHQAVPAFT